MYVFNNYQNQNYYLISNNTSNIRRLSICCHYFEYEFREK